MYLDGATLARMDISAWRTIAGDLDVLTATSTRDGGRPRYEDLLVRASSVDFGGVPVRVAALVDIVASKEWSDRPKRSGWPPMTANRLIDPASTPRTLRESTDTGWYSAIRAVTRSAP